MNTHSRPKKRIPYWCALVVGILISCIGVSLFAILSSYGTFTSWTSLEGPPSGVAQIITVQKDLAGKIWVKANDGTYYSAHLLCTGASGGEGLHMCNLEVGFPQWKPAKDFSQIPEKKILRGSNCASIKKGIFPINPAGPIRKCFYTYLKGDNGRDLYIALMTNGSLKYWENYDDPRYFSVFIFLIGLPLTCIVAAIISVIYY